MTRYDIKQHSKFHVYINISSKSQYIFLIGDITFNNGEHKSDCIIRIGINNGYYVAGYIPRKNYKFYQDQYEYKHVIESTMTLKKELALKNIHIT